MKSTGTTTTRKSPLKAKAGHFILGTVVLALSATVFSCSGSEKPKVEAAPSPSPATVEARQQQLAKVPPPELNQVQEAVRRVFKESATVDVSRQPPFLAGDFNGDLSQDLAVIVKPGPGKLAEITDEYSSWILRDLLHSAPSGNPVRVEENEVLLAIIHGYGSDGWRDKLATQTFLLKNAVGSGLGVQAAKDVMTANTGKSLPRIHGDLISEEIRSAPGYLYWAGSTYSWYDPKTFKDDSQGQVVHGRASATKTPATKP